VRDILSGGKLEYRWLGYRFHPRTLLALGGLSFKGKNKKHKAFAKRWMTRRRTNGFLTEVVVSFSELILE